MDYQFLFCVSSGEVLEFIITVGVFTVFMFGVIYVGLLIQKRFENED